jgi:hypothetical protein
MAIVIAHDQGRLLYETNYICKYLDRSHPYRIQLPASNPVFSRLSMTEPSTSNSASLFGSNDKGKELAKDDGGEGSSQSQPLPAPQESTKDHGYGFEDEYDGGNEVPLSRNALTVYKQDVWITCQQLPLPDLLGQPHGPHYLSMTTMLRDLTNICCVCPTKEAAIREMKAHAREYYAAQVQVHPIYHAANAPNDIVFYSSAEAGLTHFMARFYVIGPRDLWEF